MVELEREKCEVKAPLPPKVVPQPEAKPEETKTEIAVEMFDMFASESPQEVAPVTICPIIETCDDPDGYYKINVGETIRNYKVFLL